MPYLLPLMSPITMGGAEVPPLHFLFCFVCVFFRGGISQLIQQFCFSRLSLSLVCRRSHFPVSFYSGITRQIPAKLCKLGKMYRYLCHECINLNLFNRRTIILMKRKIYNNSHLWNCFARNYFVTHESPVFNNNINPLPFFLWFIDKFCACHLKLLIRIPFIFINRWNAHILYFLILWLYIESKSLSLW